MIPGWRSLPAATRWLLLAAFLVLLCFPLPYVLCPWWEVTVVDEGQRPLAGMKVQVHCRHHSIAKLTGPPPLCQEQRLTDAAGQVVFPEVRRSTALLERAIGIGKGLVSRVPPRLGRHGYVWASGGGREGSAMEANQLLDWRGASRLMRTTVVARRVDESAEVLFQLEFSNPKRAQVEIELQIGQRGCQAGRAVHRKALTGEAGWVVSVRAESDDWLCYRVHYRGPEGVTTDWHRIDPTSARSVRITIPATVRPIG